MWNEYVVDRSFHRKQTESNFGAIVRLKGRSQNGAQWSTQAATNLPKQLLAQQKNEKLKIFLAS